MKTNKIEVTIDPDSECCAVGNYYDRKGNYLCFEYIGSKIKLLLRLKIMREQEDCDFRTVWYSKA